MITPDQIHPLCHELVERRKHLLLPRRTDEIVRVLGELSERWLYPNYAWRRRAVEGMPRVTGFSPQMIEQIIDLLFGELTREKLTALVESELGDWKDNQTGPPLLAQVFSGNIPNPAVVSIVCGLLVRSPSFCKASSRDPLFPSLYLASLHEIDPDLASCVQLQRWKGGDREVEQALFREANIILAYGDDSSLRAIKSLLPAGKRFLGFGHKIGFAVVDGEANPAAAACDVSLYDQQGCLSPHLIYVAHDPRAFAERLAAEMENFNARIPRGKLSMEESVAIARVRAAYEFRAANDLRVGFWGSKGGDAWTVIYEDEPMFATSPLNRVVFVKPLRNLENSVAHVQQHIHNVGLACPPDRWLEWELRLKKLGAARVCPLGQMQKPLLSCAVGIRPKLRDLISLRMV
ncbi:MAG: hypothetical protein EXS18_00370 [Verrucomicrobiae bacterium]|nr:hypothetical protein [Verrucomicrobiae bacterium]